MKKLLREPLLNFLAIGTALFIVFDLVNDSTFSDADNRVVISAGHIEQLANMFAKKWQRPAPAIIANLLESQSASRSRDTYEL